MHAVVFQERNRIHLYILIRYIMDLIRLRLYSERSTVLVQYQIHHNIEKWERTVKGDE
jgi:hypothetical protein